MSVEYGIWDTEADGFIATQMWSTGEAETELGRLIAVGEYEQGDLRVREICPDHDEQPRETCEECASEEASCPDHEDEPLQDCQQCALVDAA